MFIIIQAVKYFKYILRAFIFKISLSFILALFFGADKVPDKFSFPAVLLHVRGSHSEKETKEKTEKNKRKKN